MNVLLEFTEALEDLAVLCDDPEVAFLVARLHQVDRGLADACRLELERRRPKPVIYYICDKCENTGSIEDEQGTLVVCPCMERHAQRDGAA